MNRFGLAFHHLGLAVQNETRARNFLGGLGYEIGETVHDPRQRVRLAMATHPAMPRVELVSPDVAGGPLEGLLRTRDALVYHVCYEAQDAEGALAALRDEVGAVRCVSPAQPAVLFGGRRVSFHIVAGVGLIEVLDAAGEAS